jgi:hypothetical protein
MYFSVHLSLGTFCTFLYFYVFLRIRYSIYYSVTGTLCTFLHSVLCIFLNSMYYSVFGTLCTLKHREYQIQKREKYREYPKTKVQKNTCEYKRMHTLSVHWHLDICILTNPVLYVLFCIRCCLYFSVFLCILTNPVLYVLFCIRYFLYFSVFYVFLRMRYSMYYSVFGTLCTLKYREYQIQKR